jgi:hypothetical protein
LIERMQLATISAVPNVGTVVVAGRSQAKAP